MRSAVLKVGEDGQVPLGKEYAGCEVLVEELQPGSWRIKTGMFVPDDERWLHQPEVRETLDEAIVWAETHPRQETDLDEIEEKPSSTPFASCPA
jgi:hypothetical protein